MPYLQDQEIKIVFNALFRYLKKKGQKKRVTKKYIKKIVFRDCPGLLSRAILGLSATQNLADTDYKLTLTQELLSPTEQFASSPTDQDSEHPSNSTRKSPPPLLRLTSIPSLCDKLKFKLVCNKITHAVASSMLRTGFNAISGVF